MGRASICASGVILLILANAASATVTNYFLWDDWGGTWADAEKVLPDDGFFNPPPLNPGDEDDKMCWAATASNILEWSGWHGPGGLTNTDAIFKYFQDHWTDDGGWGYEGWQWWFDGRSVSGVDVPGAGFYPTETFQAYYHTREGGTEAMAAIDEFLRAGYGTTVGVGLFADTHEITIWGFQYETDPAINPNYYTGIYITDSDDDCENPPYPDNLRYYPLVLSTYSNRWLLEGYWGWRAALFNVYGLERNPDFIPGPVPVPAPGAILLSTLGAGLVGWLRRRRTL